jgi:hypothetical protein
MPVEFEGVSLPFAPKKQAAVLWYLITDRVFFEHARHRVKPSWFGDLTQGKVCGALYKFHEKCSRQPKSVDEFCESDGFLVEEAPVRQAMLTMVAYAREAADAYGLDALKTELTEWLQAYIYKDGVETATHHFRLQEFHKAYQIITERVRLINETKFDDDFEYSFDNLADSLLVAEDRVKDGCTFGLRLVDDALHPKGVADQGGLFRKDTTCLMAPINIGKTTTMLNAVAANVERGRRVLLLIHEGEPSDIRDKILQRIFFMTKDSLWSLRLTPEGRALLTAWEGLLKERLTFIPYIKAQMTVEDIIPIIRRKCEEAALQGKPYDLLADDYPALLDSERARQSRMEERARIEYVYLTFTQLANELNLHCLVNIQVNRAGSTANRHEDRLLGMEDVSESWGSMAKVTNVITVNRSPNDMVLNRCTFHIVKSRSNATGKAIVANTDFDRGTSHSDALGGAWYWYRGKLIASNELTEYLAKNPGKEIDDKPVVATPPADPPADPDKK